MIVFHHNILINLQIFPKDIAKITQEEYFQQAGISLLLPRDTCESKRILEYDEPIQPVISLAKSSLKKVMKKTNNRAIVVELGKMFWDFKFTEQVETIIECLNRCVFSFGTNSAKYRKFVQINYEYKELKGLDHYLDKVKRECDWPSNGEQINEILEFYCDPLLINFSKMFETKIDTLDTINRCYSTISNLCRLELEYGKNMPTLLSAYLVGVNKYIELNSLLRFVHQINSFSIGPDLIFGDGLIMIRNPYSTMHAISDMSQEIILETLKKYDSSEKLGRMYGVLGKAYAEAHENDVRLGFDFTKQETMQAREVVRDLAIEILECKNEKAVLKMFWDRNI